MVDRIRQTAILFSQLEFVIDWHFFVRIMNRRSCVASGSANIHLICGSLVFFFGPWCIASEVCIFHESTCKFWYVFSWILQVVLICFFLVCNSQE